MPGPAGLPSAPVSTPPRRGRRSGTGRRWRSGRCPPAGPRTGSGLRARRPGPRSPGRGRGRTPGAAPGAGPTCACPPGGFGPGAR
ncbi:hypothetical protein F751_2464 [Auxenochlorella protothecoides]|uniref:Uncharacterized protein n=1 Tax=Auxenochlorella protothecoides TaxID=3075 RepID=A0A087SIR8_AUXPR|nr:hypothetical protein F751_2464 [Auxenochlorella protothecoides]KFM25622.1 hypothetical protein F751_2464 [Auxenochlorella protothecoides]